MKQNTFALFVAGVSVVLLLAVSLPPMMPGAAAQGAVMVMEQEPNDSRDQAQMLDLTPGGKVVVKGAVARGDGGTLVEELAELANLLFSSVTRVMANDVIEDWYVIKVNGELEFSIDLAWPGASDLDNLTFADISRAVFSDGLTTHHLAATATDNPEIEPNRIYYTYSNRQPEVDDEPMTIPDTSPYFITVSNFDGAESPPANYMLTLSSPLPGATRTVIHDTSGPGLFAPVFPSDLEATSMLALQRITPPEYPARLDRVDLLQFDLGGRSQVGAALDLVVLVDTQGTGDPTNATEKLRRRVQIQAVNAFNSYSVEDANIVVESGDIYAGFQMSESITDLHLPFDTNKVGFGRSFVSTDGGRSFGDIATVTFDVGIPFMANLGVDAILTINPMPAAAAVSSARKVLTRKTSDTASRAVGIRFVKFR